MRLAKTEAGSPGEELTTRPPTGRVVASSINKVVVASIALVRGASKQDKK